MFIFLYICMCKSLDIHQSCSFTFISSYLYTLWHLVLWIVVLHPQGMLVSTKGVRVMSLVQHADRPPPLKIESVIQRYSCEIISCYKVLNTSLSSSTALPNREKITSMREELYRMIHTIELYNPFDEMSIEIFYSSLSHSVTGIVKYTQIDTEVSTTMVKTMFPFYRGHRRVRGYSTTKCIDQLVAPFMYPHRLATHHRWPQKDEFPLYFYKQLFAEFHLHYDVDYIDYPGHVGQGLGRLSDRFRPADTPMPINKWTMVGPNLLVMPRGPQMVATGQTILDDTLRT